MSPLIYIVLAPCYFLISYYLKAKNVINKCFTFTLSAAIIIVIDECGIKAKIFKVGMLIIGYLACCIINRSSNEHSISDKKAK